MQIRRADVPNTSSIGFRNFLLIYSIFSLCLSSCIHAVQLTAAERKAAEAVVLLASTEQGRTELHSQLAWADDQGDLVSPHNSNNQARKQMLSDGSPATTQGKGFKVPFYPGNSTVFDPLKSKTFRVVPKQMFLLGYADNTHLKGYQGRDVVQIGDNYVDTKFGAITDCNSPDFNGVDGIVGFGMPVQHQAAPPPPSDRGRRPRRPATGPPAARGHRRGWAGQGCDSGQGPGGTGSPRAGRRGPARDLKGLEAPQLLMYGPKKL